MKKAISLVILIMIICAAFSSCSAELSYGTYARRNENGSDSFSITLTEGGTYTYYETLISSHIGIGEYTVDKNKVILSDSFPTLNGTKEVRFVFEYKSGKLIYLADESDDFMYISLPDGAEFELIKN